MNHKGEAVRWLIEEIDGLEAKAIYYFSSGSFTRDAYTAMSFRTEVGANTYITNNSNIFSIHSVKAIEHMFLKS